ncbi:MAG: twin-arginine translocase TatA/TatE family subunit, partial [Actinomycetia bacterium]|nr:twin-arginine translocase TatA/TatE family subunit [Actinomycetes bacterium]
MIPAYVLGLGPTELIIILFIVLLLFGPKRLPEMGKAIGQTIKEMKKSQKEASEDKEEEKEEEKEK